MSGTKQYTFTEEEVIALREAATTEYLRMKDHIRRLQKDGREPSERCMKHFTVLESLKEQFKQDAALMKGGE